MGAVTAPAVIGRTIHKTGPQGVAMNIAGQLGKVCLILRDKTKIYDRCLNFGNENFVYCTMGTVFIYKVCAP